MKVAFLWAGLSFHSLSFRKNYILGEIFFESILQHSQSFYKSSILQKKGKPRNIYKPLPTEWLDLSSYGLFLNNYDVSGVERKTAEYWVINSTVQKTARIWKKSTNGDYCLTLRFCQGITLHHHILSSKNISWLGA